MHVTVAMLRSGPMLSAVLLPSLVIACGERGAKQPALRPPADGAVASVQDTVSTAPTGHGPGAAPSAGSRDNAASQTGPAWLDTVLQLPVGMPPGLSGAAEQPATPAEWVAVITGAGGSLSCDPEKLDWVADEDGEEMGSCQGSLESQRVSLSFRRLPVPGETAQPELLTIRVDGPMLTQEPALTTWLSATSRAVTTKFGESTGDTDRYWRRIEPWALYLRLHDPRSAPCGGLCGAYLQIDGDRHPDLAVPHH